MSTLVALLLILQSAAAAGGQSLADAARREAERRKTLREQGVEGKVVTEGRIGGVARANIMTGRPAPRAAAEPRSDARETSGRPLRFFRDALKRLDRQIRETEDGLGVLRFRVAQVDKNGLRLQRRWGSGTGGRGEEALRAQILAADLKIRRLREERRAAYEAGRRAGFLPGELEGREPP